MLTGVVSFPIPLYANVPIHAEFYAPSRFVISAISLGQTTTITTTVNNNYVVGQLVRILIPPSFGTIQLNEQTGYVLSIPSANQVEVNINSRNFDPFVSSTGVSQPQILAIGDRNNGTQNSNGRSSTGTFVPGAFINISPL